MRKKDTYTVRYRNPGQWLWRAVKGVRRDEIVYARTMLDDETKVVLGFEPLFQAFFTDEDKIRRCSLDAEVEYGPDRQAVIESRMSREIGQQVNTVNS